MCAAGMEPLRFLLDLATGITRLLQGRDVNETPGARLVATGMIDEILSGSGLPLSASVCTRYVLCSHYTRGPAGEQFFVIPEIRYFSSGLQLSKILDTAKIQLSSSTS